MSLTRGEEETRSGGDGNALPAPERDTERQTGDGDRRVEGREGMWGEVHKCAGTRMCIWEQPRLEKIELGKRTANEAGGRN